MTAQSAPSPQIIKRAQARALVTASPRVLDGHASEEPCAQPIVRLVRSSGLVHVIRVECTCGSVVELECTLDGASPADPRS